MPCPAEPCSERSPSGRADVYAAPGATGHTLGRLPSERYSWPAPRHPRRRLHGTFAKPRSSHCSRSSCTEDRPAETWLFRLDDLPCTMNGNNAMSVVWQTYRVGADEGVWEPASYNVRTEDGQEYGRWRRVLRKHPHGLTVISRYKAPPGKAWRIVGKASELGEEVYIMEGAYYDARGHIAAGPGTFMFNAPGARHGGISCDLTLYIHCCS